MFQKCRSSTKIPRDEARQTSVPVGAVGPDHGWFAKQKKLTYCSHCGRPIFGGRPPYLPNIKAETGAGRLQVRSHSVGLHGHVDDEFWTVVVLVFANLARRCAALGEVPTFLKETISAPLLSVVAVAPRGRKAK
jgi:hypothetical protein